MSIAAQAQLSKTVTSKENFEAVVALVMQQASLRRAAVVSRVAPRAQRRHRCFQFAAGESWTSEWLMR